MRIAGAAYRGVVAVCGLVLLFHGIINTSVIDLGCGILLCLAILLSAVIGHNRCSYGWMLVGVAVALVLLLSNHVILVLVTASLLYVTVFGVTSALENIHTDA